MGHPNVYLIRFEEDISNLKYFGLLICPKGEKEKQSYNGIWRYPANQCCRHGPLKQIWAESAEPTCWLSLVAIVEFNFFL